MTAHPGISLVALALLACGEQRPATPPPPQTPRHDERARDTAREPTVQAAPTYVTGLEIWLPDESASFGIAIVARRHVPSASELRAPPPKEGVDATGLCIGYEVRADASGTGIGLGGGHAAAGELALPRAGLPAPVDVVVARDGNVVELFTLTPCEDACDPQRIEGDTALVLPEGTIAQLGILTGSRMFADP
jgi:hypothetical protein